MNVQMLRKITGTRDGADWPEVGGVVDVSETEARDLIASGLAVESADAPKPEQPAKRGRSSKPAAPETR